MKYFLSFLLWYHPVVDVSTEEVALVLTKPIQVTQWELEPTIIVCPEAPVSEHRAKQAAEFWRKLGYKIRPVVMADKDDIGCRQDMVLTGEILITLTGQHFNMSEHLASTRTWYHRDTREILKAKIQVMGQWGNSERLLEHELGHALGWRDYSQTNHIMHPVWYHGGYNTKGLKK